MKEAELKNKDSRRQIGLGENFRVCIKDFSHSHFSLEHMIDFFHTADLSAAQKINLLHASDHNSDVQSFQHEVQGCLRRSILTMGAFFRNQSPE